MGITANPDIVDNNLALLLDAADRNSYPGSGTIWRDLAGSNNGTLTNGPTFSSANGGNIVFDGTDDFVNLAQAVSASNWTVSHWFTFGISKTKSSRYFYFNMPASGFVGGLFLELSYSATLLCIEQYSGSIYIGGRITEYNGSYKPFIVKLDSTGSVDNAFNFGTDITQTQDITGIALDSTGSVYYTGYNLGNLVKKNGVTGATFQILASINASITQANVVLDEASNHVYIGGWFTSIQGRAALYFARLFLNTMTIDTTFDTTTGFDGLEAVQQITLQPNKKVIVGGQFLTYKSQPYSRIIRLNSDASIDTTFNVGSGFNNTVSRGAIVLQSDGKVIVGGAFTSYSGSAVNRIARLNTSGSLDTTFNIGSGFGNTVSQLAIQSDGKIVAVGGFTSYSGSTSNCIVRINPDGTRDTTFNIGTGFNSGVSTVAIQPDGKILAGGGFFTSYSGSAVNQLVRLNTNGSLDTSFNSGTGILGAYRINFQYSYRNSSNNITTGLFFSLVPAPATSWKRYEEYGPTFQNNRWHNLVLTKDSSNIYRTYWDGVPREVANQSAALNTSLNIKTYGTATGSLASTTVYNIALTDQEILQNFNNLRTRFNL